MIPIRNILVPAFNLATARVNRCLNPSSIHQIFKSHRDSTLLSHYSGSTRLFSDESWTPEPSPSFQELTRVASLVNGCDYEHWLVLMEPPQGCPTRDQIVCHYISTLAQALGNEDEAKRSIYSVSTKYYYAFSCKIPECVTHRVKSLPGVRWVLPDSYLHPRENDYGGEPFVNGEAAPYDEKYHTDWLPSENYEANMRSWARRTRRKKRKSASIASEVATHD